VNEVFKIAPVSTSFAPVLAELHGLCFDQGWDEGAFTKLLNMPGSQCLLASRGNQPEGFVLLRTASIEAEIITIAVIPTSRRKGIAKRLIDETVLFVQERNVEEVFLEVGEDNPGAISFYDNCGFEKVGRRKKYYHRENGEKVAALILRLVSSD